MLALLPGGVPTMNDDPSDLTYREALERAAARHAGPMADAWALLRPDNDTPEMEARYRLARLQGEQTLRRLTDDMHAAVMGMVRAVGEWGARWMPEVAAALRPIVGPVDRAGRAAHGDVRWRAMCADRAEFERLYAKQRANYCRRVRRG